MKKSKPVLSSLFFLIYLCLPITVMARPSSYPYLSGDTFRSFCDYVFDETGNTVIPEKIEYGDVIFLKTDYLREFFTSVHPTIINPYILITHNSDYPAPGEFGHMLDDPKIIAWFGQNVKDVHPKLHPIPIGIANRYWGHGNIDSVAEIQRLTAGCSKNLFLYMNFLPSTYPPQRPYVFQLFKDQPFCTVSNQKDFWSYLFDLSHSKFVLSPRGNGLDCHRTWETLYMGSIPIMISSTIDPLFEGLPVILIKDWNEVTQEFLETKWEEMSCTNYQFDRMYADYWLKMISSYKKKPTLL